MIPAPQPFAASDFAVQFPAQFSSEQPNYYNRLHPWLIIRQLPNMQRVTIARFRKRNEAEAHLKVLRHLTPDASYLILFDLP